MARAFGNSIHAHLTSTKMSEGAKDGCVDLSAMDSSVDSIRLDLDEVELKDLEQDSDKKAAELVTDVDSKLNLSLGSDSKASVESKSEISKKPKPGKAYKSMTAEEKKQMRMLERKWKKKQQSIKKAETEKAQLPDGAPSNFSNNSPSNSKIKELSLVQKRMQKLRDEMKQLASSSKKAANSQSGGTGAAPTLTCTGGKGAVSKVLPVSVSTPKRHRADRSDANISEEQPKKKTKNGGTAWIPETEEMKVYIRKKFQAAPFIDSEVTLLASQLQKAVIKICLVDNAEVLPKILASYGTTAGFCIVCGDNYTLNWIKDSFMNVFSISGTDLTLVEGKVLGGFLCTIFVPKPWMELTQLLPIISKLNPGIQAETWIIKNIIKHKDGTAILVVHLDTEGKRLIEEIDFKILCGTGTASARIREAVAASKDDNEDVEMSFAVPKTPLAKKED